MTAKSSLMMPCVVMLLAATCLWGQGSVTIFGTVTDAAGAVVPGANIKVINTGTGAVRTTASGPAGDYVVVQLPVGVYSVEGRATGFKAFIESDIRVQVNENRRADIRLEIGDISQNVTVKGELAQVETRSGMLSEVVDARRIVDLPLNGRNVLQLQVLLPGYTGTRAKAQEQNDSVQINGSTGRSNNYSLDGGDNHDPFFNTASPFPNPDALQEFSVNTNSYNADMGRNSGIVVNAVTKSGSNQFHGALFEFLRNKELNARSFFASGVSPFKRNQYGGTFGGPVLFPRLYNGKDKTFFFVSYQGTKERGSPGAVIATPHTQAQRQGDFSAVRTPLTDPKGGVFPGNIIPASRLSKPVQKFLETYVPLPTRADGLLTFNSANSVNENQVVLKIDHQLTSANRASGRLLYNMNSAMDVAAATLPNYLTDLRYTTWNFTLSDTHIISPTWLNTFTFTRQNTLRAQLPIVPGNLDLQDFGAGSRRAQMGDKPKTGNVNVRGYFYAFTRIPLDQLRISYQFSDQVSLTRGPHQIRFGFDLRRGTVDASAYPGDMYFDFRDRFTGNAAADFVLGLPNSVSQGSPTVAGPQGTEYNAYIQDDWRVSRRLTFNLGLRWDPFVPAPDRSGLGAIFMPGKQSTFFPLAPRGLVFEQDAGVPRSTMNTRWKQFGPRFGFAIDPFGDGKTSIRGGYGMFFGQLFMQAYDQTIGPAQSLSIVIDAPPGGVEDPYSSLPGGFPFPYFPPKTAAERATFKFTRPFAMGTYDTDYRPPIVQQWNLNVQRQFFGSYVLTLAYVGSKGNHLLMSRFEGGSLEANPAIPGPGSVQSRRIYQDFSNVETQASWTNNLYHSLQLNLNKRLSRGFTVLTSYTFANLLGNSSGDSIFNISQERGRQSIKHRFVGSYVWELPKLKSQHAIVRHTIGGWETNGIVTLQSGGYLTVSSGRDNNNNGVTGDRPDLVGNPFLDTGRPRGELINRWFNPAAFVQNQPGTIGNAGRGILQGPGYAWVDFGVVKNFHVTERSRLQYRAEFFNLFNRVNLGGPNTSLAAAAVGKITSTDNARVIQMALKFSF